MDLLTIDRSSLTGAVSKEGLMERMCKWIVKPEEPTGSRAKSAAAAATKGTKRAAPKTKSDDKAAKKAKTSSAAAPKKKNATVYVDATDDEETEEEEAEDEPSKEEKKERAEVSPFTSSRLLLVSMSVVHVLAPSSTSPPSPFTQSIDCIHTVGGSIKVTPSSPSSLLPLHRWRE
jgi:hypothetical protein